LKRIASILLLAVLLFNWFGYRILSDYYEHQADFALEQRLDKSEYDESQLIEIKVPIKLPYQTNWRDFERFDGEIEVDGIHYKYVKRKVYNDSLILLCLPHESKMKLQSARDQFFALVNDLQHPTQNKKSDSGNSISFKNPVSEYYNTLNNWIIPKLTALHSPFYLNNCSFQCTGFKVTSEQPPDA